MFLRANARLCVCRRAAAASGRVFKDFHLGRWGGQLPTSDQPHLFLARREWAACRSGLGHHTSRQPQRVGWRESGGLLRDSAWHHWTLWLHAGGRLSLSWWLWWGADRVSGEEGVCAVVLAFYCNRGESESSRVIPIILIVNNKPTLWNSVEYLLTCMNRTQQSNSVKISTSWLLRNSLQTVLLPHV